MRKFVIVLILGALFGSGSFAQLSNMSFGVRGSIGNSNLALEDETKRELGSEFSYYSINNEAIGTGGFAFWGNYSFPSLPALGIQAELGFLFNNGTKLSVQGLSDSIYVKMEDKVTYTTMELPFLVTYTVNQGGFFEFIPQAGFYLSFPIGKIQQKLNASVAGYSLSETSKDKIDTVCIFGMALGMDFAFNFTKNHALVPNLRYMLDLGKIESDGDIGTRSLFLCSLGYRYTVK